MDKYKNLFTVSYSDEEANEIGHFIMSKGYEGVQNDSYRYCRESIRYAFSESERHHRRYIYIGCSKGRMVVATSKKVLRKEGAKYIEKKRMFYKLLKSCQTL